MTAFILPGFIALADFDGNRTTLRQRLASGELHAFVPDMTGELIAILPKYWIVDSCQTWLDTGKFYDEQWRKYFPIWIKMPAPTPEPVAPTPEPVAPANRTGPQPTETDRVMQEILASGGLDAVRGEKQDAMAARFNTSRATYRKAIRRLTSG